MILIKERIGKLLEYIKELIYPYAVPIRKYRMKKTEERYCSLQNLDTAGWDEFHSEGIWGGHREYYWFDTTVVIPDSFEGKCVVYELLTGKEGEWDATNPQFSVYIDGQLRQGFDVNHREVIITECARKGETHRITLSAFTGDKNFSLLLDSSLKVLDRKTEKYYYDLSVPFAAARLLKEEDPAYITIISRLNESLNLLDLRREGSEAYYASLEKAQEFITGEFYEKECGKGGAKVYCVGHTHIDVAWLWTLRVTRDKAVRSFSTVLELMRRYPDYIFMSSQPQLYKYVKELAPEVYSEIKERVAEGRWEPEGGMFVEADCNIASGESLVRQFIYGKSFFKREFGKDNQILWLPDVFGYSAALPQIMLKCGLKYFMTTKISWNEFNKMPYDTFLWEGIDGSRVLTHFIPTRDYNKAAEEAGFMTEHFTTYNGEITPSQIKGGWARYSQKYLNSEVLNSFGYGDGGGGATAEQLENYSRLKQGIPGCPQTVMSTSLQFFKDLEAHVKESKYLPSWVGELYLEYHRGTYTSMARNKRYNRKAEFAAGNLELYGILNRELTGGDYPDERLHECWEIILRNQFHDILPGSSIKEVYDDSRKEYEKLFAVNRELTDAALKRITERVNAPEHSVVVFNPNSAPAGDIVTVRCPEGIESPVIMNGEKELAVQRLADGSLIFKADSVPGKGYKTFLLAEDAKGPASSMETSVSHMKNRFFTIDFNEKGQFIRIFDKRASREVLQPGKAANVLMTYEDRPHNYDAWDLNNYYREKSWEADQVERIEVTEDGPVRSCVRIERKYLDSVIVQYIYLYTDIPRIDIRNEIDWKEHQIFMKALFPVDVHSSEAVYEIQYGSVKRPTHFNTSWDFARFEVCAHKWLDVAEDGYGVSVINDCKYGCSVHDGVIGLLMLKSAIYPNPEADKEHHTFTYSIYPHSGSFIEAGTVPMAYLVNNPLTAVVKEHTGGCLPAFCSLVSSDHGNIVIETVKKAEDSGDVIIRLYECCNRRTETTLTFWEGAENTGAWPKSVWECSMLEDGDKPMELSGNQVKFTIMPYEIKTLKLSQEEQES